MGTPASNRRSEMQRLMQVLRVVWVGLMVPADPIDYQRNYRVFGPLSN